MTRVAIPSGEWSLVGDLVEPDHGTPHTSGGALLFVHGYGSDRSGYLRRATTICARLGVTCLVFDLSGHGQSPGALGELGRDEHLRDVLAAYDALASAKGVDPARIGVCAASYGAYLSCLLLGARTVRRLLLRAPALYVETGAPDAAGLDEPSETNFDDPIESNTALHNLRNYRGETLILESERDEVIPRRWIEAYVAAARNGTHRVIEGASHALREENWNARFLDEITTWFNELDPR